MRTIGVVTTSRADYGLYVPIFKRIESDPELALQILVSGAHLSAEFGHTVDVIEADGFTVHERVDVLLSSDAPDAIAESIGRGVAGFGSIFKRSRPDILLVLGDRYEMYAAAMAALPFALPVAHIHGGELSLGAIDDAIRHAMTKLSHLHFVSAQDHARRVIQLGESPWRVTVSGAPGLDNLHATTCLTRDELNEKYSLHLDDRPYLLITFHPVTLEQQQIAWHLDELLTALDETGLALIFTSPNADTGGRYVRERITQYVDKRASAAFLINVGTQGYFSLMSEAAAMVGNSSSGIIEAASFALPVVNIGTRQQGRLRGSNVIDVGHDREEILAGLSTARNATFRENIRGIPNPYGSGDAAGRIVSVLREVELNDTLVRKVFHDFDVDLAGENG